MNAPIDSLGPSAMGVQAVRVLCPYCGTIHVHGWPLTTPETPSITRRAKCQKGEYTLGAAAPAPLTVHRDPTVA